VVTPVIVLWAQSGWRDFREAAAVFGLAVVVGLVAFSPLLPRSRASAPEQAQDA
jgi:hypothetical protein